MENIHPNSEQLSHYMESPESSKHKDLRIHLMACENCRSRVDKLAQLELDIKHYVPRFASSISLHKDEEQTIAHYIDGNPDVENNNIQQQISQDSDKLKSALHYAVHSAAMSKNIDTMNVSAASSAPAVTNKQSDRAQSHTVKSLLHRVVKHLQWPTPAWTLAPASLAIAVLISSTVTISLTENTQQLPHIAAYQDNATITFQKSGMPAGSIGFFHDAQTRTEPFTGINIDTDHNNNLDFQWRPVSSATEYTVEIFIYENGEKLSVSQQTSSVPKLSFTNMKLVDGRHYEWQLSGKTQDGLQFKTKGDFIYYQSSNS